MMKIKELDYPAAKQFVFRSLTAKNQCSFELRKKLKERGASAEIIEAVMADCIRLGLLDDQQWLKEFVRSQGAKGIGPFAIQQKLMAKGIDSATAKWAVQQGNSTEIQRESIQKLLNTRYRHLSIENLKDRHKIAQTLQRRGYSFDLIREYLDK